MKQGIMYYFKKFRYSNTQLSDFIGCLKQALEENGQEIDLDTWVESWLQTSGVNEITAKSERNRDDGTFNVSII